MSPEECVQCYALDAAFVFFIVWFDTKINKILTVTILLSITIDGTT